MRAVRVYDLASRGDLALFRAALAAGPLLGLDVGTRHVGVAASDASYVARRSARRARARKNTLPPARPVAAGNFFTCQTSAPARPHAAPRGAAVPGRRGGTKHPVDSIPFCTAARIRAQAGSQVLTRRFLPPSLLCVRTLLALAAKSRRFAYPRAGFRRAGLLPDAAAVVSAAGGPATATACGAAVVGLPRAPSGRSCDGLRQFVTAYSVRVLGAAGVRHVGFVDEAYSSVVARERVAAKEKRGLTRDARRRKEAVDAVSSFRPCFALLLPG